MTSEDKLLDKADQLMRRHRSFVASNKGSATEPAAEQDLDADLPLLTDVVTAAAQQATEDEEALRLGTEPLHGSRRAAMMREFERWLDEQLPLVVMSAMDGITDRLVGLITQRARAELLPSLKAIAKRSGQRAREGDGNDGGAENRDQPL